VVPAVRWAKKALKDLRELHDYIARDSKKYAEAQVKKIQDTAARTVRFPEIGQIVPEFPEERWRELRSGSYRVIYRYDAERKIVRILAVVHVRRLLKKPLVE